MLICQLWLGIDVDRQDQKGDWDCKYHSVWYSDWTSTSRFCYKYEKGKSGWEHRRMRLIGLIQCLWGLACQKLKKDDLG